jgi:hypothetical protein
MKKAAHQENQQAAKKDSPPVRTLGLNARLAGTPGMSYLIMRHDEWCPGVHGDGNGCICNPVPEMVDKDTWIRSFTATGKRQDARVAARKEGGDQP